MRQRRCRNMYRNIFQKDKDYDQKILQTIILDRYGDKQLDFLSKEMLEYMKLKFYNKYNRQFIEGAEDDTFLLLCIYFADYYKFSNYSTQLLLTRFIYGENIAEKIMDGDLLIKDLDNYSIIIELINDFQKYNSTYIENGGFQIG